MKWSVNYHTHSTFSDGKQPLSEMVQAACDAGLTALGISDHSPVPVPSDWNMRLEDFPLYLQSIEAEAGRRPELSLFKGIEIDYLRGEAPLSADFLAQLDYTIGSVHYLSTDEGFFLIDGSFSQFETLFTRLFDGDIRRFTRCYATQLCEMLECYRPVFLGHIDLIAKFNEQHPLFDENNEAYLTPLKEVMELAASLNTLVEINTGAIARGYRSTPYPNPRLLTFARDKKIPLSLNSDAHSAKGLTVFFDATLALLNRLRIPVLYQLKQTGGRLQPQPVSIEP